MPTECLFAPQNHEKLSITDCCDQSTFRKNASYDRKGKKGKKRNFRVKNEKKKKMQTVSECIDILNAAGTGKME